MEGQAPPMDLHHATTTHAPTMMCSPARAVAESVEEDRISVTFEVCMKATSTAKPQVVHDAVARFLECRSVPYRNGPLQAFADADNPLLDAHVQTITICDTDPARRVFGPLMFWQFTPCIYVYQLNDEGAEEDEEGEDGVPSYREWILPSTELEGLWDSLYFDSAVQHRLLRYATSALVFSDAGVSTSLVSWNRVVLLHGPPGTGKTSLCKALAQKLAIRLGSRYRQGQLVEVNAHSLFSKYFSESGKLVSKLFAKITELVEEEDSLVFVLIDEVESLTAARKAAVSGSEPSDSVRAVNALLTQLDQLKRFPNVMVLTTSNVTEAIDVAFVDRADIKAYIGPPTLQARYEILRSSLLELCRVGIIAGSTSMADHTTMLLPFRELSALASHTSNSSAYSHSHAGRIGDTATASSLSKPICNTINGNHDSSSGEALQLQAMSAALETLACSSRSDPDDPRSAAVAASRALAEASLACEGFSGRSLRRVPFLAHARGGLPVPCGLLRYIGALREAAMSERADRGQMCMG